MHRLNILTAAAALLIATPVFAQELRGPDPYAKGSRYSYGYDHGYYDNYQRNDFWPGRVAGEHRRRRDRNGWCHRYRSVPRAER